VSASGELLRRGSDPKTGTTGGAKVGAKVETVLDVPTLMRCRGHAAHEKRGKQMGKKTKLTKVAAVGAGLAAAVSFALPEAHAAGGWNPISGATTWNSPCNWFTSSNTRYVSPGGTSAIKVNLSSVGPLGVKFRVLWVNTGLTSNTAFIPPLNTAQTLAGSKSAGTPFRNQFSCVNGRGSGSPSTDFNGSEYY
jgi:hypothetical protein